MYGKFVMSAAGHDSGKVFIVIGNAENGSVFIADGKVRKIEKPKTKKLKHLIVLEIPKAKIAETPEELNNSMLRKELKRISAEAEMQ